MTNLEFLINLDHNHQPQPKSNLTLKLNQFFKDVNYGDFFPQNGGWSLH